MNRKMRSISLAWWGTTIEPNVWDVIPNLQLTKTSVLVSRMPIAAQWIIRGDAERDLRLVNITSEGTE